jgi:hypothetical protein
MAKKASVVTQERYASGFTFSDYLEQVNVNKEQFQKYYGTAQISAEDATFFRQAVIKGLNRLMVIGEDWCPDVFRGMPLAARLAETAGLELRIFPRDQNLDIANEFLKEGKYMSIPVVVFYSRDLQEIARWIERPAVADMERAAIEAEVRKEMPGAEDTALRAAVREGTQPRYPAWQKASLKEMRQLLTAKLGL